VTPAVSSLERAGIAFRLLTYEAVPAADGDIGVAAARSLGVAEHTVFKTLISELAQGELVVAIVPVAARLNLKLLARAAGAKSASMAQPARAEKVTGYVTGGISPFGQKKRLRTFLADQAEALETIHVSAGKRGLELALSPADLIGVTGAVVCELTA
jgi:Cys-tRNA(Pro)/Cys-tRNA(Cys) deacylase